MVFPADSTCGTWIEGKSVTTSRASQILTILIAEDNSILAKSIARRLRQIGIATEVVTSAEAFGKSYVKHRFEAICLDLQLPDGNGLDLLEFGIRANKDDVPVLLITGTGTEEDRARAERHGAVAFLIKPFALSTLTQILERYAVKPTKAGAC
jgi:DNA-binding response OmpR family regulator